MAFANVQNTNQVAWAEQSRRRNEGASVRYQWQCQGANRHTHAHTHKKHAKHAQSQGEGESKGKQHFAHIGKVFGKRCAILGAFSPLISICSIGSLLHFANFILICSNLAVSESICKSIRGSSVPPSHALVIYGDIFHTTFN